MEKKPHWIGGPWQHLQLLPWPVTSACKVSRIDAEPFLSNGQVHHRTSGFKNSPVPYNFPNAGGTPTLLVRTRTRR
ncbi:hypothetical protein MCEMSE15_00838 [Fimbriimonadaceae bacterium]